MQRIILLLPIFFISFLSHNVASSAEQNQRFDVKTINRNFLTTTKKITYYDGDQQIGFLFYEHLPLSLFVLHTGFIEHQHRNQRHGTALLQFTCNELKRAGARKIIIQPGPFEQRDNKLINIPAHERSEKLQRLVQGYQRAGFSPAPRYVCCLARYLYKIIGIDEDADYLMML
ncbi:MAG TPA: GNAT family N-acetyltransferase [Candidatus Babeliales bacterium]|nr:GNAT family N-acetyltransferase [Candidatus Babeliales bacterium]